MENIGEFCDGKEVFIVSELSRTVGAFGARRM
jgi:hypothetical protein